MSDKKDIWDTNTKKEILTSIKNKLVLYLFKDADCNLEYAIKELFDLEEDDIEILKIVHFLLSPQVTKLVEILPSLMRNLAHSTNLEKIESRGVIRGQINWNDTYKRRYIEGYDNKSLFICNSTNKQYDLEENQLLKYMLNEIYEDVKYLANYNILNKDRIEQKFDKEKIEDWNDQVLSINFIIRNSMKNVRFKDITKPRFVKPKMLKKALKSRNILYHDVAKCYELYEILFLENSREKLIELISKQILEPINNDRLYELYIFFKLLEPLDDNKLELGLLRSGNDYTAKYKTGNKTIKIYYQLSPKIFSKESKYKKLEPYYTKSLVSKRPDIIIEYDINGEKTYRIVEVKRTENSGYITASIYKVFGYLYDYQKVPLENPNILVVWDGIKIIDEGAYDKKLTIMNKDEFLKNRKNILLLN